MGDKSRSGLWLLALLITAGSAFTYMRSVGGHIIHPLITLLFGLLMAPFFFFLVSMRNRPVVASILILTATGLFFFGTHVGADGSACLLGAAFASGAAIFLQLIGGKRPRKIAGSPADL